MLTAATTCGLFLFLSSAVPANADTIFESLFPTACVTPLLGAAGFCVLNAGCTDTCFKNSAGFTSGTVGASPLSLNTEALENFYIPVDAVECEQMEDPICAATTCCPACRDELVGLYRCLIIESEYQYLDYLANSCAMDCSAYSIPTPIVPSTVPPVGEESPILPSNVTEEDIVLPSNETDFMNMTDDEVFEEFMPVTAISSTAHVAPEWIIPLAGAFYPPMTVRVGDSLTFAWSSGTHDVYIYPNGGCDRTDKILIGSTRDNPTMVVFGEADAGKTLNFACDIGSHCELGMRMEVNVMGAVPVPPVGVVPPPPVGLVEAVAMDMP